jgi:hypothetical protein
VPRLLAPGPHAPHLTFQVIFPCQLLRSCLQWPGMGNERPDDEAPREQRLPGESEERTGQEEAGLPLTFYERLQAASVDEKLVLAREAAGHPGFDEEDAFEVGSRVEEALNQAGRYAELEGLLDAWRERAPRPCR